MSSALPLKTYRRGAVTITLAGDLIRCHAGPNGQRYERSAGHALYCATERAARHVSTYVDVFPATSKYTNVNLPLKQMDHDRGAYGNADMKFFKIFRDGRSARFKTPGTQ